MQNSNSLNSNNILDKIYLFFNLKVILDQRNAFLSNCKNFYAENNFISLESKPANYYSLGTTQTGSCSFHSSNFFHVEDIMQDRRNEFDFRV
jgi:hypothetical protein